MKPPWLADGCGGEQKVSSLSPRQVTAVVRDRLETRLTTITAVLNAWSARLKDLKIMPLFQEQSDCTTVCVTVSSSTETHQFLQVQMRPSLTESCSSLTPPRGGISLEECFFTLRPSPFALCNHCVSWCKMVIALKRNWRTSPKKRLFTGGKNNVVDAYKNLLVKSICDHRSGVVWNASPPFSVRFRRSSAEHLWNDIYLIL